MASVRGCWLLGAVALEFHKCRHLLRKESAHTQGISTAKSFCCSHVGKRPERKMPWIPACAGSTTATAKQGGRWLGLSSLRQLQLCHKDDKKEMNFRHRWVQGPFPFCATFPYIPVLLRSRQKSENPKVFSPFFHLFVELKEDQLQQMWYSSPDTHLGRISSARWVSGKGTSNHQKTNNFGHY